MSGIVMLAGPIEHWWDDNWETEEHWRYVAWRDELNDAFVAAGWLVYRPHEAMKGAWRQQAQTVNDRALEVSDVVVASNLVIPVPCKGTDAEVAYLIENRCKAFLIRGVVPEAGEEFPQVIAAIVKQAEDAINGVGGWTAAQQVVRDAAGQQLEAEARKTLLGYGMSDTDADVFIDRLKESGRETGEAVLARRARADAGVLTP